jgi:ABC-type dipeptide/oligopeptide/nickel transport system permease component
MAVQFVLVNLVTDLIHGMLDPRIRQGKSVGA